MNKTDGGSVPLNQHSLSVCASWVGSFRGEGRASLSLRDGRDGRVAGVARIGPEEPALSLGENADLRGSFSHRADKPIDGWLSRSLTS